MREVYLLSTLAFWLLVAAFWVSSLSPSPPPQSVDSSPDRQIAMSEVARHAQPDDCWMAIRGQVHDLTEYLPEHPSRPQLVLPWCGKDATEAYETKSRGRRHSDRADELLASYRIGSVAVAQ